MNEQLTEHKAMYYAECSCGWISAAKKKYTRLGLQIGSHVYQFIPNVTHCITIKQVVY